MCQRKSAELSPSRRSSRACAGSGGGAWARTLLLALRLSVVLVLAPAVSGCLPDPDEMLGGPPDLSGVWRGTIEEVVSPFTTGNLTLTANHQENYIDGTFTAVMSPGLPGEMTNSGTFVGQLNESRTAGTFTLSSSNPTVFCPMSISVSLQGPRIVGTFAAQPSGGCVTAGSTGNISIAKQ